MNGALPDTFWTTQQELLLFGGACLMGVPAGVLFDLWRILRRLRKCHPAMVAVQDVLWLLSVAVLLLGYAAVFAKGVFRGYFVIGCGAGFLLYECTLGALLVRAVSGVCMVLLTPVERLGTAFASICKKTCRSFVKTSEKAMGGTENVQKRLHKHGKMVYNSGRRNGKKGKAKWQQKQKE